MAYASSNNVLKRATSSNESLSWLVNSSIYWSLESDSFSRSGFAAGSRGDLEPYLEAFKIFEEAYSEFSLDLDGASIDDWC